MQYWTECQDLIEPYWNVKKNRFSYLIFRKSQDLIEPYWNVKYNLLANVKLYPDDLIEPYWNVKTLLSTD